MEKLQMCRLCLVENVRMFVVVNKDLHELYEKLSGNPYLTEDSRPLIACFVCCAQLKKSFRLLTKCREAEKWFAQIMNGNYEPKPVINQEFHAYINSPIQIINIVDVGPNESMVKKESPADIQAIEDIAFEIKVENQSDDGQGAKNLYDNYLDIEYTPIDRSELVSQDHELLSEMKIEEEEEQEVSIKKRKASNTNRASVAKKLKIDERRLKSEDALTSEISKEQKPYLKVIRTTQVRTYQSGSYSIKPSKLLNRKTKLEQRTHAQVCKIVLYQCDVCQRSFTRKNTLSCHIRTHTGEKPYICNICQRGFTRNNALKTHIQTHKGEKPYKCDACPRKFATKGSLSRHTRLHAGVKPYKCDVCQHSFNQMYHLKRHALIHTNERGYQCDVCQGIFSHKDSLINHFRKHTGEKPFKCDLCWRSFINEGSLRNHSRIHTGEKPYKCDLCWRSFRNKSFIAKHIRKHTGDKC